MAATVLVQLKKARKLMLSQLKNLLFIFQASLEESPDDKSAMQLIGLLLFKYYRKEALEPYLKILCSSGLKCRSEDAFDVTKTILWKIIHRHSACFKPSLSFYVVNIDVTDEKGNYLHYNLQFLKRNRVPLVCSYQGLPKRN